MRNKVVKELRAAARSLSIGKPEISYATQVHVEDRVDFVSKRSITVQRHYGEIPKSVNGKIIMMPVSSRWLDPSCTRSICKSFKKRYKNKELHSKNQISRVIDATPVKK